MSAIAASTPTDVLPGVVNTTSACEEGINEETEKEKLQGFDTAAKHVLFCGFLPLFLLAYSGISELLVVWQPADWLH